MATIYRYDTGEKPCVYVRGEISRFELFSHFPLSAKGEMELPHEDLLTTQTVENARAFKLRMIKAGYFNQVGAVGKFNCPNCTKCFSAAISTDEYEPRRSQRKIMRKNEDIEFDITKPFATREAYDLFVDYLEKRHPDSNMRQWSFTDFRAKALLHSHVATLKLNGQIVAMSLIDADKEIMVGDYCFYDVEMSINRNLGSLMDLEILEYAQETGRAYVSFGALNEDSPKLKHKAQYDGTRIFSEGKWHPFTKRTP